jgi:hypothetical protein
MNAIALFQSGFLAKPLSDCRVFGLQRLDAVQNMHNLHRFVGYADNNNSLRTIYVADFEGFLRDSGGERGIRTPDRAFDPITV